MNEEFKLEIVNPEKSFIFKIRLVNIERLLFLNSIMPSFT